MLAQLAGAGLTIGGTLYGMDRADAAARDAAAAARLAAQERLAGISDATTARNQGTERSLGFLQQLSPWANRGMAANGVLDDALGVNGAGPQANYFQNFQNDPGYNATLKAGTDSIEQSQAGGGLLRSGGTLKALHDYGGRLMQSVFSDRLNRLAGVGQAGQSAATTMATGSAGITDSAANTLSNLNVMKGEAQAGGTIGESNAYQRGTQNQLSMLAFGMGKLSPSINDLFGGFGGGSPNLGNVGGGVLGNFKAGY